MMPRPFDQTLAIIVLAQRRRRQKLRPVLIDLDVFDLNGQPAAKIIQRPAKGGAGT